MCTLFGIFVSTGSLLTNRAEVEINYLLMYAYLYHEYLYREFFFFKSVLNCTCELSDLLQERSSPGIGLQAGSYVHFVIHEFCFRIFLLYIFCNSSYVYVPLFLLHCMYDYM